MRSVLSLSLVACLGWWAGPVFAGEAAPAKKLSKADEKRYAMLIDTAKSNYKVQEYDSALESYKEAYVLYPEPALLFNIGQCYRQMGQLDEAEKSFQRYLTDDPTGGLREQAEALLVEIEKARKEAAAKLPPPEEVKPEEAAPQEGPQNPARPFYFAAAGAAALSVTFGTLGLIEVRVGNKVQEEDVFDADAASQEFFQRSRTFAIVADISGGLAIASGVAGFIIGRKAKPEKQARVLPTATPKGAGVLFRF
jgi:tetratricopeptide (TPR) repeat protein